MVLEKLKKNILFIRTYILKLSTLSNFKLLRTSRYGFVFLSWEAGDWIYKRQTLYRAYNNNNEKILQNFIIDGVMDTKYGFIYMGEDRK